MADMPRFDAQVAGGVSGPRLGLQRAVSQSGESQADHHRPGPGGPTRSSGWGCRTNQRAIGSADTPCRTTLSRTVAAVTFTTKSASALGS